MVNLINFVPLITLFSMDIAKNIKKLHEERGLTQKEVANVVGVHPSNYSKMEKDERKFGIEVIDKLAKFFGLTIDEMVHPNNKLPKELKVEDKTATEKIQLISQLDVEDKNAVYRLLTVCSLKTSFKRSLNKTLQ